MYLDNIFRQSLGDPITQAAQTYAGAAVLHRGATHGTLRSSGSALKVTHAHLHVLRTDYSRA